MEGTPEWVLVGVRTDDGVTMYAAQHLGHADVQAVLDGLLSAGMEAYVAASGATYAEAMRNLSDLWDEPAVMVGPLRLAGNPPALGRAITVTTSPDGVRLQLER